MPPADFQNLDEDEPVDVGTLRQALTQQSQQVTQQVAGMLEETTAQQNRALDELARRVRQAANGGNGSNGHEQDDPREQLARAAKELGLTPEQLEKAAQKAKREQLKTQLREIAEEDPELIAAIWDEGARLCLGDDYDENEDEENASSSKSKAPRKPNGKSSNGKTKRPTADTAPGSNADSEPEYMHWSERPVSDWFK